MSFTMDGTAVARMVDSMATSPVVNIKAMRMGPRSDRKPTSRLETLIGCAQPEYTVSGRAV
jgi:hypothetical protein